MPYRPSPIELETEQYGTLRLRPFLVMGDVKDWARFRDLDARELTVRVISRLIYSPTLDVAEIRSWDDNLLINVAQAWATGKQEPKWELPEGAETFEAFRRNYVAEIDKMNQSIQNALRSMQVTIAETYAPLFQSVNDAILRQVTDLTKPLLQSVQSSLNLMTESVLSGFQANIRTLVGSVRFEFPTGKFFENLPDFTQLVKGLERYDRAADVLEQGGYRFLFHYWTLADIAHFVGVDQVDVRVRKAVMTNKLLGITRQDEFIKELEACFQSSSVLRRRWRIVEQAVVAHRERNYTLSIPTLLAQVEGMFTDALVLKGIVIKVNNKVFAKDSVGNFKLNIKGKPIELAGLDQKVRSSDLKNELLLQDLAQFFTSGLIHERNDIMHGHHISYDKARRSAELILNIYVMAAEFADLESGNK